MLLVVSVTLLLAILGSFVAGCALLAMHRGPWRIVLGTVLVALAVALHPPLGLPPRKRHRIDREQAPTLLALIERVAQKVGAPVPDFVVLDNEFDASVAQTGVRQRTTLGSACRSGWPAGRSGWRTWPC
ncbi:MAG TPA: hypothetical protein VMB79_15330 [Jatrophihabitans sp.]|nr:hypothetical protein [Jatrophihabitans sp.]